MFGLEFLFGWALLALPLAGAPVLLHLLFRRKSPIVPFSTLRFIRASVQRTAARKRIQQWLLLACRVLLLALLIWAVAQPAKLLASHWLRRGGSAVAAVVVDDSYSMLLQHERVTRLDQANDAVQDLLREELRDARVALFTSNPRPPDQPETLQTAESLLSEWSPLKPEPSPRPLADRVAAASNLLDRQDASDKWLIVLSDLQSKEFPRPLPAFDGGRFVLLDLHADDPRSVGITKVTLDPEQPIPGVLSEAVVEITGRAGDSRAVSVTLNSLDGQERYKSAPVMANLDAGGRVELRFPVQLPSERFIVIRAVLSGDDDLPWDDSRSMLVEIPSRQAVRLIASVETSPAERAIRLALDPNEGRLQAWPLDVRRGNPGAKLASEDRAVVAVLLQWPSASDTQQLSILARQGGSIVLCLQPGLEQTWAALPEAQRTALAELLPSVPATGATSGGSIVVTANDDPLLQGLTDDKGAFPPGHVRRLVHFASDRSVSMLLGVAAASGAAKPQGLLFRKAIGNGVAYTLTSLPDAQDSNLATSPAFLPLLVRMCMRSLGNSAASNVELGQPLVIHRPAAADGSMTLETPGGGSYVINGENEPGGRRFGFDRATEPGLYTWRERGKADAVAVVNVGLPSSESDLVYRPADSVIPHSSNVVVARSMAELRSKMAQLTEPEPRWSGAVAVVLLLICMEALMSSASGLWKPVLPNLFPPKVTAPSAST